ncbi:MAG: PQQ-binding-like beta-propeller repeat protein [Archangiaceae bacterium]|nr:PQQ-binding-like beta-propeller repeat protein [Archangiaceae bacterium]
MTEKWKDRIISVVGLTVAMALVFGGIEAWLTWGPIDSVRAFAVSGNRVLVIEENWSGEEDPGGVRIVAVDPKSGEVLQRKRVDDERWVAMSGELLWLRTGDGLLARDASTLAVKRSAKEVRAANPVLAPLAGYETGCFDVPSQAVRFQSQDGRYLAFTLATESVGSVQSDGCTAGDADDWKLPLADGRSLSLKSVPASSRSEVLGADGVALGVSGLELKFLRIALESLAGDVLIVRTTGTGDDAATELVRVDVVGKKERWATRVTPRRTHFDQVEVRDGLLFVRDTQVVSALDLSSGELLWQRGPSSARLR